MYNEKLVRTALRYQAIFLDVNRESLDNSKFLTEPVVAFIKKLSDNGYTVSEELLHALSSVSKDELLAITAVIDDVYGVNLNWTPLVKHWDIPTGESYMDHFLTFFANVLGGEEAGIPGTTLPCGHFIPDGTFPLERYNGCPFCGTPFVTSDFVFKGQGSTKRELRLFTEVDMRRTLNSLLSSPVPLDATQRENLKSLLDVYGIPENCEITVKENLMFVVEMFIGEDQAEAAAPLFQSPVDIMRFLWYKKTGQIQIIEPKTLISQARKSGQHMWRRADRSSEAAEQKKNELKLKFTRPECRMVAVWMNSLALPARTCCELMNPKREMWVRFIHALHLGEYSRSKRYPHLREILDTFYKGDYSTWQGRIDAAVAEGDTDKMFALLKQRPGAFARTLFSTMLTYGAERTLDEFTEVSDKLPARLFVSLENAASIYFSKDSGRIVKTITGLSKAIEKNKAMEKYTDEQLRQMAAAVSGLYGRAMEKKFKMQECKSQTMFIDERLNLVPLAVGDRASTVQDASCVLQGTRFKVEGDAVRLFLQWGKGLPAQHLDMDLSCRVYYPDAIKKFGYTRGGGKYDECAYYNLTCTGCRHSGDIREIPDQVGTAEYIEMNLSELMAAGAQYVMFTCNAYSCGDLVPNLEVGWMNSANPMKIDEYTGVAYDPSCVQHMVRITEQNLTKGLVFGILDVPAREIIWLEMPFDGQTIQSKSFSDVEMFLERLKNKMTVGKMLRIKAEAQGIQIIEDAETADEKYTFEWALQPEEVSKLLA